MKRLAPRKSSRRRSTLISASSAASVAMSSSSLPRRCGSVGRRRATSKRAARRSSACRRAIASWRVAVARRRRSHSRDSASKAGGDAASVGSGIDGSTTCTVAAFDDAHAALSSVERREDPDGELGLTAALDELDQRVQVVAWVAGDRGRERGREARSRQLVAPPASDLVDRCSACRSRLHVSLVTSRRSAFLPRLLAPRPAPRARASGRGPELTVTAALRSVSGSGSGTA